MSRHYRITLAPTDCLPGTGCLRPTDMPFMQETELTTALQKATSGGYSAIQLANGFYHHPQIEKLLCIIAERGFPVCIELCQYDLNAAAKLRRLLQTQKNSMMVDFYLDQPARQAELDLIRTLLTDNLLHELIIYVESPFKRALPIIASVPVSLYAHLRLYAPYCETFETSEAVATETRKLHSQLAQIESEFAGLRLYAPTKIEIFHPAAPRDRELEPVLSPRYSNLTEGQSPAPSGDASPGKSSKIQLSVVIPTFNNWSYLKKTLAQFAEQTLAREKFEVIVVDDGSNDETAAQLPLLAENCSFNLSVYRHERPKIRNRGQGGYSAGIARNIGVKNSVGEVLLFLDTDILIPHDYLQDMLRLIEGHDLIQGRRLELSEADSASGQSYGQLATKAKTALEDEFYWGEFYSIAGSWAKLRNRWHYVCSHSLCVRRSDFMAAGWFKKTFCFYGFEDNELGYRMSQAGKTRFHLHEKPVFHLHQSRDLSEYRNSHLQKTKILRRSAAVFYRNTLDENVYEFCEWLFARLNLLNYLHRLMHFFLARLYVGNSITWALGHSLRLLRFMVMKPYWYLEFRYHWLLERLEKSRQN